MKIYYTLLIILTVLNAGAQSLSKIFQHSAVPDRNVCGESTYNIFSITHDSRGNYYYTCDLGLHYKQIVATNNSGEQIWSDTVKALSSQTKSFVFVNRWGEVLWFHHKLVNNGYRFLLNTYNHKGEKLSSRILLREKVLINEIKAWQNQYIILGCQGIYDSSTQKTSPMLMIQALVDENGNMVAVNRMQSSKYSYTAEPQKSIIQNDKIYMAGSTMHMIKKGENISYIEYPAIFACHIHNDQTVQYVDTTLDKIFHSYSDIVYQDNNVFAVQYFKDSVHHVTIDVFDTDLHLLKRKTFIYKSIYNLNLIPYIRLYDDSVYVIGMFNNYDSLLVYSGHSNIDTFSLRKYTIRDNSTAFISKLKFNTDKSYTLYYADTCDNKQSLIIKTRYLHTGNSETSCYVLADSVKSIVYVDDSPNELYVGALELYQCRVNHLFKTTMKAAYVAHYSFPIRYMDNPYLTIFPNPASNSASIYMPESLDRNLTLELFSSDGKTCKTDYTIQDAKIHINTSALTNGLYILRIYNHQSVSTAKLIVQHH